MTDQPTTWFTAADVEAARQRLIDNRYGGPDDVHDLDREDLTEIVQIVLTATWQRAYESGLTAATEGARELTRRWWWPDLADARQDFERLVGPWEPAPTVNAEPTPVQHAAGCMCGFNDAGQRFDDPICRRP